MKELIEKIISDEVLSNEEKTVLIEKIVKASHGIDKFITPGFYLHSEINKENEEVNIQLWYRNQSESGMTFHGPTNYDNEAIFNYMKTYCLDKLNKTK